MAATELGEAHLLAAGRLPELLRKHLTPGLRARGYVPASNQAGEWVWRKRADPNQGLRLTNRAGDGTSAWVLSVEFCGVDFTFLRAGYLDFAPPPVRQSWQERAAAISTRGGAVDGNPSSAPQPRAGTGESGLSAWPWSTTDDLVDWLHFVVEHLAPVEQAAVAAAEDAAAASQAAASEQRIWATREDIAEVLFRYGETDLCQPMLHSDDATWVRVMSVAADPEVMQGRSASIDTFLAAGAIEVLTGVARPPARRCPRPEADGAELWRSLGIDDPHDLAGPAH